LMKSRGVKRRRDVARPPNTIVEQQRGFALIGVILLLLMMSTLAAAIGMNAQTETLISRNHRSAAWAQAAAEAGLNHAIELVTTYQSAWRDNGFPDGDAALDALLLGPDLLSGTSDTDADNGSLEERPGIDKKAELPIGKVRTLFGGSLKSHKSSKSKKSGKDLIRTAEYSALVIDDTGAGETGGDPFDDQNRIVIVQATGYGPDSTKVVLEAMIGPIDLGALVVDGDLLISGDVEIINTGGDSAIHANGDLDIPGKKVVVSGTVTASGEYTGTIPGSGGVAEFPVPEVDPKAFLDAADFILTSKGEMTNPAGTVLCTWSKSTPCNEWAFDSKKKLWFIDKTTPPAATYYVKGDVDIRKNIGTSASPARLTVIAEGSIEISGAPHIVSNDPAVLFVVGGDLKISGALSTLDPSGFSGQAFVHEQLEISGKPTLYGQFIVENASSNDKLVKDNLISGTASITYNPEDGNFGLAIVGWRDVRE
jgi:Tfp pilus assembly protein PilX